MSGVHSQLAGEGAAQHLVGGDQRAEAFVDLAVHALLALLDRQHHQDADANPDQGEKRDREDREQDALPRTEVEISHAAVLCLTHLTLAAGECGGDPFFLSHAS